MADRKLQVKFSAEGYESVLATLRNVTKGFDDSLKKAQEAAKLAQAKLSTGKALGDTKVIAEAEDEGARAAVRSNKIIEQSFKELRLKSTAELERQKADAIAAFNAIKTSGVASAKDIENAQKALQARLKEIAGTGKATAQELNSGFARVRDIVGGLATSYLAFQAAISVSNFFKGLIADGIKFNSTLEDSNIGIASLITSLSTLSQGGTKLTGAAALEAALPVAQDQVQKIRVQALQTLATSEQIVTAFQAAAGAGLQAGLSLDQVRTVTVGITQAAGALRVPATQLNQEVVSILEGTIDINSRVAKALGINNEQVKAWKAQGILADELNKKLIAFNIAGAKAAQTFTGVTSNLQEARSLLAGLATAGFFEQITRSGGQVLGQLFNVQTADVASGLKPLVAAVNEELTTLGQGLGVLFQRAVDQLFQLSDYVKNNQQEVRIFFNGINSAVQGFVQGVELVSNVVGKALKFLYDFRDVLVPIVAGLIGFKVALQAATALQALATALGVAQLAATGFSGGFAALGTTILTALGPAGWIALLVGGLVAAGVALSNFSNQFTKLNQAQQQIAKSSVKDLKIQQQDLIEKIRNQQAIIDNPNTKSRTDFRGRNAQLGALQEYKDELNLVNQQLQKLGATATQTTKALDVLIQPNPKKPEKSKKGPKAATASIASTVADSKAEANAEYKIFKDNLDRQAKTLDFSYQQNQINFREYYLKRATIQKEGIDAEIARTNALIKVQQEIESKALAINSKTGKAINPTAANNAQAAIIGLEADLKILQRQRIDATVEANREIIKSDEQLLQTKEKLKQQLLQDAGQNYNAFVAAFEAQYNDLILQLERAGDKEGLALLGRLFDSGTARAKLQDIQSEYNRFTQQLTIKNEEVQQLVNAGTLGQREGQTLIKQNYIEVAKTIQEQIIPQLEKLRSLTTDPSVIAGLDAIAQGFKRIGLETQKPSEDALKLAQTAKQGFADFFDSIFTGSKSAGDAFTSFAETIIKALIKIASQKLAESLFESIDFAGFFKGLGFADGGYTGSGGKYQPAGVVHRGEFVIPSETVSRVGPGYFNRYLPGYADGGLVTGLSPSAASQPVNVTINLPGVRNVDDFRRSQGQIEVETARTLERARARS